MGRIDPCQMKQIYAIAGAMGMTERGNPEDQLHLLVEGMTGKTSVAALTGREAELLIGRLCALQGNQAPAKRRREPPSRPGGVTPAQQKKIWALMYELQKYDQEPAAVSLGERLCAVIKKELGVDAVPRKPFAWLDFKAGNRLIEALKGYVESAGRKRGCGDGLA